MSQFRYLQYSFTHSPWFHFYKEHAKKVLTSIPISRSPEVTRMRCILREGIREIVNYTVRNAKLNSLFTVTKTHFPTSLAQTRPKRGHFFTQGQLSVKSEKYDPDPLPPPKKKRWDWGQESLITREGTVEESRRSSGHAQEELDLWSQSYIGGF